MVFTDHWVPRMLFVYLFNEVGFPFAEAFHKAFNNIPNKNNAFENSIFIASTFSTSLQ